MNKIRQRREELGISQTELGKMIGCSQQHILRIENGYEVGADKALRLSEALKLPMEDIISEKWKNVFNKITTTPQQIEDNICNGVYEQTYKVVKVVEDFINDHNLKVTSEKKAELVAGLVKKLMNTPANEQTKVIEFAIDWELGKQVV